MLLVETDIDIHRQSRKHVLIHGQIGKHVLLQRGRSGGRTAGGRSTGAAIVVVVVAAVDGVVV